MDVVGMMARVVSAIAWAMVIPMAVLGAVVLILIINSICDAISNRWNHTP